VTAAMILMIGALTPAALAARLELVPARTEMVVGGTSTVTLQLVDGRAEGIPEVPVGVGLHLSYLGQGRAEVRSGSGRTPVVQYRFALGATAPGAWSVGPVTLDLPGGSLIAPAITVTVHPGDAEPPPEGPEISAVVDDASLFLGQTVVYRLQVSDERRVLELRWNEPTWDGLVPEPHTSGEQTERVEGTRHLREIAVPLVATGQGRRTISPAALTLGVAAPAEAALPAGFSGLETLHRVAEPVPVEISPLPAGTPEASSRLVGRFTIAAEPDRADLTAGDALTLDVRITGDGTLAGLRLPTPEVEGLRFYDTPLAISTRVTADGFAAEGHLQRTIVPERVGALQIPAVALTAFDPTIERFSTITAGPWTITVRPGAVGGALERFSTAPDTPALSPPPPLTEGATAGGAAHRTGLLALKRGDFVAAERHLREALTRSGPTASVYLALGNALEGRGASGAAMAAWRRGLVLSPRDAGQAGNLRHVAAALEVPAPPPTDRTLHRAGAVAALLLSLIAGLRRRNRLALAGLLGALALGAALWTTPTATVISNGLPVLSRPGPEGRLLFVVPAGTQVELIQSERDEQLIRLPDTLSGRSLGGWALQDRTRRSQAREGWVPSAGLSPDEPGATFPRVPGDDPVGLDRAPSDTATGGDGPQKQGSR